MAQSFQKRPYGWHIAGRAWISAAGALLGLLPFYAVMTGLLFALGYGLHLLEAKLGVIRPRNDTIWTEMVMRESWYYALAWLVRILLVAPVAVATLRYVLVDDGPRLAPGPMLRAWLWTGALAAFSLAALYLTGVAVAPSLGLLVIVLKIFAVSIPLLLTPVFPAVAAGAPPGRSRIETALEQWEGGIWRFAVAIALTLGPLYYASGLPGIIAARAGAAAATSFQEGLPGIALNAVLTVVFTVVLSSTLAWLYAWARQDAAAPAAVAPPKPPAERREPTAARPTP